MPRDISGNYTLPVGNPVVDGTIIDVGWANPTMSDIAVQLNNVITRDGVLGATAPIKFDSGTAGAPSITFTADPALGFYRGGSNILGFSTAGTSRGTINATGNWTIPAPSSGVALSVVPFAGSAAFNAAAGSGVTASLRLGQSGVVNWDVMNIATTGEFRITNGTQIPFSSNGAGNVTINAPSSGIALTVSGTNTANVGGIYVGGGGSGVQGASVALQLSSGNLFWIGPTTSSRLSIGGIGATPPANGAIDITAAGNVTINAPSSGVTLAVTPFTTSGTVASFGSLLISAGYLAGSRPAILSTGILDLGTNAVTDVSIFTNNTVRLVVGSAGNVTINAPSSGTTLTVSGLAGSDTTVLNGGTSGSFRVNTTGVPYGTSLHNNAGAVTGTTNQYIASGTYTPTLFNTTNVSASTAYSCQWIRVGNVVTVSGKVDISPTAATTGTILGMSIPIASALTATEQLAGTGMRDENVAAAYSMYSIRAEVANDRAEFTGSPPSTGNAAHFFTFTYVIL